MIQVAIVGFGLSGQTLQAPFFARNPHFRLKTIVTKNQNPQAIYPDVEKAASLSAVLADATIDLVSITSPDETHVDYARQCLLAGKHVLVEKPFAASVAEAEELIILAEKQGRHLFVFQNRRFDSDFMTVRQVIEQGLLGEVLRYEAHYNRHVPALSAKKWKEQITPSSGILYGLGPHIIDQSIGLFGKPQSVWGQRYIERAGSIIDDAFDVFLDYGKVNVHLSASLMVREDTPRYVVHGTKGSFIKYGIDQQEDHLKAGLMPNMKGFGAETPQYRGILNAEIGGLPFRGQVETLVGNWGILFQNIADVILQRQKPLVPVADVVEQIRIMRAVKWHSVPLGTSNL